jgi:hypothetical protein
MRHEPNHARPTQRCKIKPVYPAFRSVSTPRRTKDLPVVDPVDPKTAVGTAERCDPASEWSAHALSERLRTELGPRGWTRLVRAAAARGNSVEQLHRTSRAELA